MLSYENRLRCRKPTLILPISTVNVATKIDTEIKPLNQHPGIGINSSMQQLAISNNQ